MNDLMFFFKRELLDTNEGDSIGEKINSFGCV